MMSQMMEECCGQGGMPDFEKIKEFMEKCGKTEFTEDEIKMIRQLCGQTGKPDAETMQQLMARCGC